MKNTKGRHREIYAAAEQAIKNAGGVEAVDALSQNERKLQFRQMVTRIVEKTNCTIDTGRRNITKALQRARHGHQDTWGGSRESDRPQGRAPLPEDQKRVRVSTRLAPGYLEKAKGIAEIEGLKGWGRAVEEALDRMIEGDPDLKVKLIEMGVIFDRVRVSEPETLFDDGKNQSVVRLRGWESSPETTGTITLDDNG